MIFRLANNGRRSNRRANREWEGLGNVHTDGIPTARPRRGAPARRARPARRAPTTCHTRHYSIPVPRASRLSGPRVAYTSGSAQRSQRDERSQKRQNTRSRSRLGEPLARLPASEGRRNHRMALFTSPGHIYRRAWVLVV